MGHRGVTRILVTHQVHFLPSEADWIVILKDGQIDKQGSPADLSGVDIFEFCEETDEKEGDESDKISRNRGSSRSQTQQGETKTLDEEEIAKETKVVEEQPLKNIEQMSKGRFKGNVAMNYIKSGSTNILVAIFLVFLFFLTQVTFSLSDYWVSF